VNAVSFNNTKRDGLRNRTRREGEGDIQARRKDGGKLLIAMAKRE
jgi:hypothetical protein